MMIAEDGKSRNNESSDSAFLNSEDKREFNFHFEWTNNTASRQIFEGHLPVLTSALSATHTDYQSGRDFILGLARLDIVQLSLGGVLTSVEGVVQELGRQDLAFDSSTADILLRSTPMFVFEKEDTHYVDKVTKFCVSHARNMQTDLSLPLPEDRKSAVDLTEDEASWLGSKIVRSIQQEGDELMVSPFTSSITIEDAESNKKEISMDVVNGRGGTEYMRVGKLFFVNSKHKGHLPEEAMKYAETNIIFVDDMHKSEFADGIVYFAGNTVASMMETSLKGSVVLDCGSGSGLLSLAAMKLGAKGALAIESDGEKIEQARANFAANGYSDNPAVKAVTADLFADYEVIFDQLSDIADGGEAVIVSEIGSWPDYGITNLTSFHYINRVNWMQGWFVGKVISGGYSSQKKNFVANELPLLRYALRHTGTDQENLPEDDMTIDSIVLEKLGFKKQTYAVSEQLNIGKRSRIAQSSVYVSV